MNIWLYIIGFVIIGIPFIGFAVDKFRIFGRWVYKEFPIIRDFFDDYASHYAVGFIITVIAGIAYSILHFGFGIV